MIPLRRARLRVTVVAAIVLCALLVSAIPASADPAPRPPPLPKSPPTADQLFERIVDADQKVLDATIRLHQAETASSAATRKAWKDRAGIDVAARAYRAADHLLIRRKAAWRQLIVRAYVGGAGANASQLAELLRGKISDTAGQAVVMLGQVVKSHLGRIRRASLARAKALTRMRRLAARAPKAQDAATTRAGLLVEAQDHLQRFLAYQTYVRSRLRKAAHGRQPQVSLATPILGIPRLSPEDLTGWFKARHYKALTNMPVEFFAQWYIDEGLQEGVRGDIAFVQAVLETGGFTNIDSVFVNNYAGIGHCDTCPRGFSFKSPQGGVRAQIQLLKSYALKRPSYANPLVDPRLHGPAGCCPTWGDLTRKWATAPTYGPRIMEIYTDLMGYALRRHAALLPPS